MVETRTLALPILPRMGRHFLLLLALAFFGLTILSARAMMQFDVFPGYDGVVPEASWFPIICEIKNDGPSFTGTIEVSAGRFNEGQTRRLTVELPTGTLKRVEIPAFSTSRYQQNSWEVRLLDERGRVRAEQLQVIPRRQVASATTIIGALPRTATGVPSLRPIRPQDAELQPSTARFSSALIPDNPLVFEGMDSIYLNSERAADLNDHQIFALLAWLNNGGHLIVGIEQINDVNGVSWLKKLVPCDLTDMKTVSAHPELQEWLRGNPSAAPEPPVKGNKPRFPVKTRTSTYNPFGDVAEDLDFEKADLQVVTGTLRDGTVLASASGTPLLITSRQGRGRVTTIMSSPERKPLSAWKNLPSFWAKLAEISPELYVQDNNNTINTMRGGWSIDGVFGAMIDSKQVRKLPVEWLLLLLIVYLVVIGPLDQYWLKRIKRPMLTWVTFPCYVVMFSLLIYFIGYKLRAGETEWNELHLVDVLQDGDTAQLRGHTYASIYSPVNATYRVETQERFSTFRGEFLSSFNGGGGQGGERAEVFQSGDNFKADIFVPVWTSQLYVSDWWQPAPLPLKITVNPDGANWSVTVANMRDHPLSNARLVIGSRIVELGELPARQTKTFPVKKEQGTPLRDFVSGQAGNFQNASSARQQAFGSSGGGRIGDLPNSSIAISFISNMAGERFISPPGLDLSRVVEQGNAVLLAWESDYSPIKPLNNFPSRRGRTDTLWRLAIPVNAPSIP
ncbi:MAG: hypothetical protein JWQ04_197 [Pedosphaera sp.]|nr:hypothetical protein [Pedosphaera sp.]